MTRECGCDAVYWDVPESDNVCVGEKLECRKRFTKRIGDFTEVLDLQTNTTRTCLAACSTTYYTEVTPSAAAFPAMNTFLNTPESCIVAKKLVKTCKNWRRGPLEEQYPGICQLVSWINDNQG